MSIGRNDPCTCGSGKKYKKCHGAIALEAAASTEAVRAKALKTRDVELGGRLLRFTRMHYGAHWLHDVLDATGLSDDGELSDAEMPLVIPWLLHKWPDAGGMTPAGEWRRREGRRISSDERLLLEAYDAAWVSLWEVAEVEPGTGSRLIDMLTREERFVHDVASSATLQRFDTILAIVLTCDGVSFFGGVHAQPLAPRFAAVVTREARRMCRVRTRPVSPDKLRDPDSQLELLALWNVVVEDMLNQPPPFMQNMDGDPLLLTRDDFALRAPRHEVARHLASLPGVHEPEQDDDDMVFVVTQAGNPLHRSWDNTVIGRIVLSGSRLTVETNSARRADALRSAVESHLQGLVRFRLRKEDNTMQLMASARESATPRPERTEERLPSGMVALMRKFRERHMREWLDQAIPALDGLTPRQAARFPGARAKLETLLKEFEQAEARLPEQQRIDLQWIREALELS